MVCESLRLKNEIEYNEIQESKPEPKDFFFTFIKSKTFPFVWWVEWAMTWPIVKMGREKIINLGQVDQLVKCL
jgi:hypothetical protein